jgi:hypothetical protein
MKSSRYVGRQVAEGHFTPRSSVDGSLLGVSTVHDVALARIEILEGRSPEERRQLVDVVAMALSDALEAPPADPSVRLLEYPRSQFLIPYPDRHSVRFTLVEVTMFSGRSMETSGAYIRRSSMASSRRTFLEATF